ncbi:MAG TPA: carboxypeptidase regulatory-like domain-containing protein [Candidatus Limnocylindrales bacterium]|nr:carboxypeptidase regulatory-like domain-containing protein [Candidatus Limnocylindrales bacterium]
MKINRLTQLAGALLILCGSVFGQSATATLQGTVLDPGGATVPDVTVVIKNVSTGATRNTVSGADGTFILNGVEPATYNLTISAKTGFKEYSETNIAVTPNERRDLGKITLELGTVAEKVTITASSTPVQTSSSENSKLIESSQIENITVKGRDVFTLLQTIPGVSFGNAMLQGTNADATSNASGTFGALQINGGGTARTNFTVDGVVDVDNGNNAQVDFEPTMDTIAEIRVLTSNYQAEFGHSSSGQISLITKGGSTSFHGSAFFNKRHEMFNAKDFFTNLRGNQKATYRYGVGGYSIGGPIYIPKIFNVNKNQLFFFWSQEYTRTKPSSTQAIAMVPTADQLKGNFYDRCLVNTGVNGVPCIPSYTDNNGNDRSTFLVDPSNGKAPLLGGNLTNLMNTPFYNAASAAVGQAMLKYLPSPNLCTAAAGIYNGKAISPSNCPAGFSNHPITDPTWNYGANYFWTATEVHPRRNDTARVDWNINQRLKAFVRYSQDYDKDFTNFGIPVKDAAGNFNPTAADFTKPGHGYAVNLTWTISPTMVNEFTFGKIFNGIGYYEADDSQVQRANMGNPPSFDNFSTDPLFTNDNGKRWLAGTGPLNFANYVPVLQFGDAAGRTETAPSTNPCWNGCPYTNWAESWSFADSLSKVVGKHNLKAGVYIERTDKVQVGSQGNYLGTYSFNNDTNNPLDTQDGFANAWLGNYRQYSEGAKNLGDWWYWQTEIYAQDSWRVTPRLTLDLGIRLYGMPPITNVNTGRNASAEFVASAYNPNQVERLYVGACVTLATNTLFPTNNGPCPNNATVNTRAYDPGSGTFAISSLIGTFVPNSVAHYASTATPFPGMLIAGTDPRLPQGLYKVPFLSPAGRFGFAWDVFGNGKTAIRGGIGQFLNRLSYNQIASPISFPPTLTSLNLYYGNISGIADPATKSLGAISPGGMNADFVGNQQNESTYNGSLQVQRKVGFSTVVEASWVFELRRHVPINVPLDYFPLFSQFNNGAAWVNPQTAYLQNNALTGYQGGNSGLGLLGGQYIFDPSVCSTCVFGYTGISKQDFEGTSNYNALQVNVRRNMTRGLSFGWAFTWDKSMGPGGALLNNNDPAFTRSPLLPDKFRDWGPSYSPTPFYFTFNAVYEVPGLGQRLNFKPLGWVTDHWTLSGLYQWRSDAMTTVPNVTFANTNTTCSSAANCYPQWNWTGTPTEGVRYNITGDYHLSAAGDTLQINPAGSTVATNQGTPSTPGYGLLGTDGNRIINTAAFTIPYPCSQVPAADPHYGIGENLSCLGNAGAGQIINVPGTRVSNLDMTVSKAFPLKREGTSLMFRAEMYNLPNHTQFSGFNISPSYDWRNWLQGRLVQTNSQLNRFTGTLNPRQMEMSLRLVF